MTQINFGSTYRIPITQPGINNAKKDKLRTLVESYDNGLIGKSKTGYARVSMSDNMDNEFVARLKSIGYKVFQKFEGENISKENIDAFIKEKLDTRNYSQKGKKMKPLSREMKEKRRYEKSFDVSPKTEINIGSDNDVDKTDSIVTDVISNKERIISVESDMFSKDAVRKSDDFIRIKNLYGDEFAEAMFFGR